MGLSPDVAPAGELSVLDGSVLDGGVLDRSAVEAGVVPLTGAAFADVVASADVGAAWFPLPHAATANRRAAAPTPVMARRRRELMLRPVEPSRVVIIYQSFDGVRG